MPFLPGQVVMGSTAGIEKPLHLNPYSFGRILQVFNDGLLEIENYWDGSVCTYGPTEVSHFTAHLTGEIQSEFPRKIASKPLRVTDYHRKLDLYSVEFINGRSEIFSPDYLIFTKIPDPVETKAQLIEQAHTLKNLQETSGNPFHKFPLELELLIKSYISNYSFYEIEGAIKKHCRDTYMI